MNALTTGVDDIADFTGGAGVDTFIADNTSNVVTSTADELDGSGGTDTLKVYSDGSNFPLPQLTNIENVTVFDQDDDLDLSSSNFDSASKITLDRGDGDLLLTVGANASTVNLANIALEDGAGSGTARDGVNITADPAATAISLGLNNISINDTGDEQITLVGAALETVSISATGTKSAAESINAASATTVNIDADVDLDSPIATGGTEATLNVSGAGKVTLGQLDNDFDVVNASGNTGGVVLTTAATNLNAKTTLGSGNDEVTTAEDGFVTADKFAVDAGAGTEDVLVVANVSHINTSEEGDRYTNFEIVRTAVDQDLSLISGITAVQVEAASGGITLDNLSATQAAAITVRGDVGSDLTLGLDDASGTADAVTVNLASETAADNVNVADLSVAGVETLTLNAATGTAGTDSTVDIATNGADDLTTLNITGSADVDFNTSGEIDKVVTVDATSMTGDLTFAGDLTAGSEVNFAGGDDIATVSSTLGSTYKMNAGDDTVTAAVATLVADGTDDTVLNGGDGTDELRISDNGATLTDNHFTFVSEFEELTFEDGSTSLTTGAGFNTAFANGVTITNAALADTETFTYAGGLYSKDTVIDITSAGAFDGAAGEDITITSGAGDDDVTVTASNWVGSGTDAGDLAISTAAGDDKIAFTTGTLADANVGTLTITGGAGKDLIEREGGANGSGASAHIVYSVATEGDSLTTGYDEITGFKTGDGTDQSDLLDFGDGAVAASLNSENSGSIKSHSLTDGVVSFDDADSYATALVIDSNNIDDAIGYLDANASTDDVVAFEYDNDDDGTADSTMVWHQGDSVDDMVMLVGVTGVVDLETTVTTDANYLFIG